MNDIGGNYQVLIKEFGRMRAIGFNTAHGGGGEEYGIRPIDILDLTVPQEIIDEGPWCSVTVYWSPDAEDKSDR